MHHEGNAEDTTTDEVKVCNVMKWIEENSQFFTPPVCNKLMHGGTQLEVMFVGGPNVRKDYHIETGEELFYQMKGDMVLQVLEGGKHKDIRIQEGQIFLLPRAIPHSPQRFAGTIGLVLERQRPETPDGLRFFTEVDGIRQTDPLYEVWFQWGKQSMAALFEEFYNSEQHKTGKPIPGTIPEKPPVTVDTTTYLDAPFDLKDWIQDHRKEIDSAGKLELFDCSKHQIQAFIYGLGVNTDYSPVAQTWIWQMKGQSSLTCQGKTSTLATNDCALIPIGHRFTVEQQEGSSAFVVYQDPTKSPSNN